MLAIFETHIVPLKPFALRPALKSVLLALLPGLEEENSDEFDRTLRMVNALKDSVADDSKEDEGTEDSHADRYFWQCMFLACITSSTRRPGALSYLIRYLPNLGSAPRTNGLASVANGDTGTEGRLSNAVDAVVSPEPGLLIRCFCAGLQDQQPLTQRGFLDLLVTHLPLSSAILQESVVPADLEKLVLAATSVVSRKDMSLNRRLWSWFLGPEPAGEINGDGVAPASPRSGGGLTPTQSLVAHQTRHFERYGLKPLIRGILSLISKDSDNPAERTKPLRISLSLMDRWEIGGLVAPRVFLAAMQSVWKFQRTHPNPEVQAEVLRSANMFFDGVESSVIWSELHGVISHALTPGNLSASDAQNTLEMADFIVNNFNIREEEMQIIHMPAVLLMILARLLLLLKGPREDTTFCGSGTLLFALKIANRLLELIPHRAIVSNAESGPHEGTALSSLNNDLLTSIENFYVKHKGNVDASKSWERFQYSQLLLENILSLLSSMIKHNTSRSNLELDAAVSLLFTTVRKGPLPKPELERLLSPLLDEDMDSRRQEHKTFAVSVAKISTLEAILSTSYTSTWVSASFSRTAFPTLLDELWPFLSPSSPKNNVEAVRCIWRLYSVCFDRQIIDSTLVTLMVKQQTGTPADFIDIENARKFATLWTHSPSTSISPQGRRSSLVRARPDLETDLKPMSESTLLERPLLLLLDSLSDPTCTLFPFVVNWLQSLNSLTP